MATNQKVEPKTPNVSQASGVHYVLVAIGCALVILFALGAVANHFGGSETTEVTKPAKDTAAKDEASTGTGTTEATEKTTTSTAWPSDTLLTTLLGAGAALIIVGFLYSRISSITLPGGAKVDLTPAEAKKGVELALDKLSDDASPEEKAAAVTKTLAEVKQAKAEGLEVPTEKIAAAADRAVASLTAG